jgi:hypothetical protein
MKAGWIGVLLLSAGLAGCAGGETGNPNLAAPKLVLESRPDGRVEVFVHGAFSERLYDWVALAVDNATVENRTIAFSLERTLDATGFYLDASAGTPREMYVFRGRLDVHPIEERVSVSFHTLEGEWSDPESFSLPFERLLTRKVPS